MDIFIFIHILPPSFNIMIPGEPFSLRTNPPGGQKMAKKRKLWKITNINGFLFCLIPVRDNRVLSLISVILVSLTLDVYQTWYT